MNVVTKLAGLSALLMSPTWISSTALAQSESDRSWDVSRQVVEARTSIPVRPQAAKNVILFIADGMSVPTVTAARIYDGQSRGEDGEANILSFETFPHMALIKTYNANMQTAESASTASAIATGVRTRGGVVSVRSDQFLDVCENPDSAPLTLAERAEDLGMATGIISSARLTHATPASWYAHSLSREWEAGVPDEYAASGCQDIASQLIDFDHGDGIELALGGGRRNFLPSDAGGVRPDDRNLLSEWETRFNGVSITTGEEFRALDVADDAPVLGLFTNSHLSYEADREQNEEPSLAEMTRFAIDRLSRDEDGYALLVEAGRVDHAHHATNAYRALTDMQAFADAIAVAVETVDLNETLIIVTADHGHTMTISGYAARGNNILGLSRWSDLEHVEREPALRFAQDGKPYTTLGYQNGPVLRAPDSEALTEEQVLDPNYRQQAGFPMGSETHSGDDVPLYANGPRAHVFGGSLDQNTIFHLIAHALDWSVENDADE
ncbi:alkaline phosphatase [Maricaulis sp. D1M11]|uniref:alkaline phosphatase n=1 Tax=Maricaulis sp. D1M11 TaxID=3076117 RepID=UPI0039B59615